MPGTRVRLVVRQLRKTDLRAIQEIQRKSFPTIPPWTREELESQLTVFPEGQIGVEIDGALVATSSSLIVDEEDFGAYHTFDQVSDKGIHPQPRPGRRHVVRHRHRGRSKHRAPT
jgi:hypothetical protein